MKPRHDIPSFRKLRGGAGRRNSCTIHAIHAFTDKLVDKALLQMKALMDQGLLSVDDIEKFQALLANSRQERTRSTARHELLRFIEELMKRGGGPFPGASPMPAPVFPRGNPPSLSGAAEASLE